MNKTYNNLLMTSKWFDFFVLLIMIALCLTFNKFTYFDDDLSSVDANSHNPSQQEAIKYEISKLYGSLFDKDGRHKYSFNIEHVMEKGVSHNIIMTKPHIRFYANNRQNKIQYEVLAEDGIINRLSKKAILGKKAKIMLYYQDNIINITGNNIEINYLNQKNINISSNNDILLQCNDKILKAKKFNYNSNTGIIDFVENVNIQALIK